MPFTSLSSKELLFDGSFVGSEAAMPFVGVLNKNKK